MVSKKKPHRIKQTLSTRHAERLQRKGWILSGQYLDAMSGFNSYTLIRPNPKYEGPDIPVASVLDPSARADAQDGEQQAKPGPGWQFKW